MSRVFFAVYLLVLAPLAAVVMISALLLFHVPPPVVFAPGRAVKALFEAMGFHPANGVAVASTGAFFWLVLALAGFLWERRR